MKGIFMWNRTYQTKDSREMPLHKEITLGVRKNKSNIKIEPSEIKCNDVRIKYNIPILFGH